MRKIGFVLVVASVAALLGCPVADAAERKITVVGASTVQPVVEDAAMEFKARQPDVQILVSGGGSDLGARAAGSGEVMIGMVSRELSESEKAEWKDLVPVKIAMDGVAVIVHKKNPVSKITREQVQDVYTGRITNWKALGGPDAPIVLISKERGRSTLELFLNHFGLEANQSGEGSAKTIVFRRKGTAAYSTVTARAIGQNREALAAIVTQPHGIAYVSIGTAQEVASKGAEVKLLDLDGVAATTENVARGTYPLRRPLHVVTKGAPKGVVKEFVDFLMSADGQRIVTKHELIPAQK